MRVEEAKKIRQKALSGEDNAYYRSIFKQIRQAAERGETRLRLDIKDYMHKELLANKFKTLGYNTVYDNKFSNSLMIIWDSD